jgi:hypothetical protein
VSPTSEQLVDPAILAARALGLQPAQLDNEVDVLSPFVTEITTAIGESSA